MRSIGGGTPFRMLVDLVTLTKTGAETSSRTKQNPHEFIDYTRFPD